MAHVLRDAVLRLLRNAVCQERCLGSSAQVAVSTQVSERESETSEECRESEDKRGEPWASCHESGEAESGSYPSTAWCPVKARAQESRVE